MAPHWEKASKLASPYLEQLKATLVLWGDKLREIVEPNVNLLRAKAAPLIEVTRL